MIKSVNLLNTVKFKAVVLTLVDFYCFGAMNAIKKRLQTLKIEKDLAIEKADACDQQSKEAKRKEEKLMDEVRQLSKKLSQMQQDLELNKTQLVQSNFNLDRKEKALMSVS